MRSNSNWYCSVHLWFSFNRPEETHSTQIGLASCEEKRSNLKKLQNMFDKFFDDVAPALVAVLSVEDPSDDIRFPALSLET